MTTFAFSSLYKLLFTQDILRYSPEAERKLFIILPCYCEIIFKKCQNYTQRIRVIFVPVCSFHCDGRRKKITFWAQRAPSFFIHPYKWGIVSGSGIILEGPPYYRHKIDGNLCRVHVWVWGEGKVGTADPRNWRALYNFREGGGRSR